MRADLIVSTYNAPRALALSLASVARQSRSPSRVLIADDGSGQPTRDAIARASIAFPELEIEHVWHEDHGFEKNAILNKAIAASSAEYLVFTDGDCLLHPDFLQRHVALAAPGRFVCGSLIRLSAAATDAVTEEDVLSGRVFGQAWQKRWRVVDRFGTWLKSAPMPFPVMSALEVVWPIRRSWMGSNSACWRADALAVNGYDEEMKYGGGDKEFGIRLRNAGIRPRPIRFTAPVLHLDHPRGYADPVRMAFNRERIEQSRQSGRTWAEDGLAKARGPA